MNPADEGLGLGWIAITFCGFIVGYVLAKIKVLSDRNSGQFCTWASAIIAAVFAFGGELSTLSFIQIGGRIAIFVIIWFFFGIVFTLGIAMGMEKAEKVNRINKPK
ncbi:MAG TPA: hypothetical protein VIP51_05500 [Eoetvoesiella sp.]